MLLFQKTAFFVLFVLGTTAFAQESVDYVNPFIGASTAAPRGDIHGLGKTFPGAAYPFGLAQVSPNTITGGDNGPGYSYEHDSIEGFAFTQMSGIGWYGDLGNLLTMPTTGPVKTVAGNPGNTAEGYRSKYDKSSEKASAGYYAVRLTDYDIQAEATVARYGGALRFTFPENEHSHIQIDLARRVGGTSTEQFVEVVDNRTIRGWMRCTPDGGGWGNGAGKANYTVHFYAQFSRPFDSYCFWSANIPDDWKRKLEDVTSERYRKRVSEAKPVAGVKELQGKHIGFVANYATKKDEVIEMKAGISFVDMEGAEKNFRSDLESRSFDEIYQATKAAWNAALGKIRVKGGTEDQKTIFYTALYHTMIDPRDCTDIDGRYWGGDNKPHQTDESKFRYTKRTIFSGWDVFRSQMPLQTLINPIVVNDMINSLVSLAEESGQGRFERWEFLNAYSGCMIGNPAISVLLDARSKGIAGFDAVNAYKIAKKTALEIGNGELGYYSAGGGSISNTLEYAYSDWCMSKLAEGLGGLVPNGDAEFFAKRAQAYRNVFDSEKGWFRPRNADGSWQKWPEKGRLADDYGCVESNPYQQGWFVPHDVDGMVELMGGRDKVLADLIDFFEKTPKHLKWNSYYNHANEPVHHIPFLFNRLGRPDLTQFWTRHICQNAYKNSVDGLCGNEDVGQMSAWFVLASIGIHQLCPGDPNYEITSPLFDEISIQCGKEGQIFTIKVHNNSPENVYIDRIILNRANEIKNFSISHDQLTQGGTLEIFMQDVKLTPRSEETRRMKTATK